MCLFVCFLFVLLACLIACFFVHCLFVCLFVCLLGSFSRARLRIYEAMGGKSHDMSFCVEVEIRQWNSSTANKTYPQDAGTGRC